MSSSFGAMGSLTGLLVAVSGLFLVAQGQVISCFVSIENNTHNTYKYIQHMNKSEDKSDEVKTNSKEEYSISILECPHCKSKVLQGSIYCPKCGGKLS